MSNVKHARKSGAPRAVKSPLAPRATGATRPAAAATPTATAAPPTGLRGWWAALSPRGKAGVVAGTLGVYSLAVWGSYSYVQSTAAAASASDRPAASAPAPVAGDVDTALQATQPDQRSVYDRTAAAYDREIAWDEFFMGLLLVRRWVVGHAKGDTLEIAAGTGRNLGYYAPAAVTSLTLTDASSAMLDQAAAQLTPSGTTSRGTPVSAITPADAAALPFPSASFDTVVSTFSLCSVARPVASIREALRVVRPGGRVWLLEHGRGSYAWLNRQLDNNASAHASKWGCYFNRDIGALVDAALAEERRGLAVKDEAQAQAHVPRAHVKSVSRLHFGTTWVVEIVRDA
ncbi:hypothetical protein H9P43_005268 [Blastocladiella emersonii ATCC 22665]|nr:hypothetical protein H9P43_005268 [Blastocladiella emersonii ATCC 22665]